MEQNQDEKASEPGVVDLYGIEDKVGKYRDSRYFKNLSLPFEEIFGVKFQQRESSFVGSYLIPENTEEIYILIQYNMDPLENFEVLYPEFSQCKFIVNVESTGLENADSHKSKVERIEGVIFLNRTIISAFY